MISIRFKTPIHDLSDGALPAAIYRCGELPDGKIERRQEYKVRTESQKGKRARQACGGICTRYVREWVEIKAVAP